VNEVDRLEAAVAECREMVREAHAATKDLRTAVREAKSEIRALTNDEVAAHIQAEVSRQLEVMSEQISEAITAATQKVIADFDRFGESLLGKEAYWERASGRRSATRPDTDVVALDVQTGDDQA
jgi:phage protein D